MNYFNQLKEAKMLLVDDDEFIRDSLSIAFTNKGCCMDAAETAEEGMKAIKNSGGRTIAESEESCIVYGMPKAVVTAGLADKIVPVNEVAGEIMNAV